jgi:hypothetical protein
MFLNDYVNHERHKDLLREADQQRLARDIGQTISLTQRLGQSLLKLGAQFAAQDGAECVVVENRAGQVVTVCAA